MFKINRQIQAPQRFGGTFHEPGEAVDLSTWESDAEGLAELARLEQVGDITRLAAWTSPTTYVVNALITATDLNAPLAPEEIIKEG